MVGDGAGVRGGIGVGGLAEAEPVRVGSDVDAGEVVVVGSGVQDGTSPRRATREPSIKLVFIVGIRGV